MKYSWKMILGEGLVAAALFAFFYAVGLNAIEAVRQENLPSALGSIGVPAVAALGFLVGAIYQVHDQRKLWRGREREEASALAAQAEVTEPAPSDTRARYDTTEWTPRQFAAIRSALEERAVPFTMDRGALVVDEQYELLVERVTESVLDPDTSLLEDDQRWTDDAHSMFWDHDEEDDGREPPPPLPPDVQARVREWERRSELGRRAD